MEEDRVVEERERRLQRRVTNCVGAECLRLEERGTEKETT